MFKIHLKENKFDKITSIKMEISDRDAPKLNDFGFPKSPALPRSDSKFD